MNGIAFWTGFYRENPHKFVEEYLRVILKYFQQILLFQMMHNVHFIYLASRGQGKTFLTALFCVVRCILYPGTKIAVVSSTRPQANEVLLKITNELMKKSPNLCAEIKYFNVGAQKAEIEFYNGSWIRVVTAADSGRGARANILVVDEFRLVEKAVIDTVLKRFLAAPRQPNYLNNPKYAHLQERNIEIYMSSAWLKNHWCFDKTKSYIVNMLAGKKYYVCALPYQLSILEGLLSREDILDEMSEADFDETTFMIEMGCIFFGDTEGCFFSFDDISKQRILKYPMYHIDTKGRPKLKKISIQELLPNEKRILSVDIALMSSKKNNNDASSIIINSAIPTNDNTYIANVIYLETHEGLTTSNLALVIRRLFNQYNCTDLVIDTNGSGLGVYDELIKDIYDADAGVLYNALTCINDKVMAERCTVPSAIPCIWSIKANAGFNTEICTLLRNGFKNRRINLLPSELKADEILDGVIDNYSKLNTYEKVNYKNPYVQTTLLIYELVNLEYEVKGTNIRIFEKRSMRKDRYSSLAYNYWVQCQLERQLRSGNSISNSIAEYAKKLAGMNRKPKSY